MVFALTATVAERALCFVFITAGGCGCHSKKAAQGRRGSLFFNWDESVGHTNVALIISTVQADRIQEATSAFPETLLAYQQSRPAAYLISLHLISLLLLLQSFYV
jgi:hypothetical protein